MTAQRASCSLLVHACMLLMMVEVVIVIVIVDVNVNVMMKG